MTDEETGGTSPPTEGAAKPAQAEQDRQTGAVATPPPAGPQPTAVTAGRGAGEPTANANARRAVETGKVRPGAGRLSAVRTRPMPVSSRTHFKDEGEQYHYHWFGNDPMRIEYALSLGYEFVTGGDGKHLEAAGQVAMRVPYGDFAERKNIINQQVTPAAEAAPRQSFLALAESKNVEAEDQTRTHRGGFSTVASESNAKEA